MKTYKELLHAMQSGVAFSMATNPKETDPKHLRVGINAAMSDQGGLVTLLIAKGVFTEEEYIAAITAAMEREVTSYERKLSEETGKGVTLG